MPPISVGVLALCSWTLNPKPCLALPCPALPCPALPCPALPWLSRCAQLDGFIEGELKFRPTYKFDPGETPPAAPRPYSDYKNRTPSWTDRVLCR